jgi:hypothetical protein
VISLALDSSIDCQSRYFFYNDHAISGFIELENVKSINHSMQNNQTSFVPREQITSNNTSGMEHTLQLPIGLNLNINDEELLSAFESMIARANSSVPPVLHPSTIFRRPSVEPLPTNT